MTNHRFSSMWREYELRTWMDSSEPSGDGWRAISRAEARSALEALGAAHRWDVRELAAIHAKLFPHSLLGMRRTEPSVFWERAWPELVRAAETGLLRVHGRERILRSVRYEALDKAAGGVVLGPAPEPVTPAEDFWIAIELVDEDGKPVPNERYRVRTPDGRIFEGTVDGQGKARVGDLPSAGNCEITFPDLDGRDWQAA